jgi:hypothetical protein
MELVKMNHQPQHVQVEWTEDEIEDLTDLTDLRDLGGDLELEAGDPLIEPFCSRHSCHSLRNPTELRRRSRTPTGEGAEETPEQTTFRVCLNGENQAIEIDDQPQHI